MEYNVQLKMGGIKKKHTKKPNKPVARIWRNKRSTRSRSRRMIERKESKKKVCWWSDPSWNGCWKPPLLHWKTFFKSWGDVTGLSAGASPTSAQAPLVFFFFVSSRPPPKQGRNFIWKKKHKRIPSTSCFFCFFFRPCCWNENANETKRQTPQHKIFI